MCCVPDTVFCAYDLIHCTWEHLEVSLFDIHLRHGNFGRLVHHWQVLESALNADKPDIGTAAWLYAYLD